MTELDAIPDALDAYADRLAAGVARIREQARALREALAELGVQQASPGHPQQLLPPVAPSVSVPAAAPARRTMSLVDEKEREEQMAYLAARKSERAALVAQNRGEG